MSSTADRQPPDSATAPLFPLDQLVLLPGTSTQLHVFEPRYRDMVAHALAGEMRIAMAVHVGPQQDDADAVPRVHPTVCLGDMVAHHPLPDGRSLIRLTGLGAYRIEREDRTRLFRVAELTRAVADCADTGLAHRRIRELCAALDAEAPEDLPEDVDGIDHVAHRLCALLPLDTPARQRALEIADVDRRLAYLLRAASTGEADPHVN